MFTFDQIARICQGKILPADAKGVVTGISTDSRTTEVGSLFVALRGDHYDGHHYISVAFSRGAVCALVDRETESLRFPAILVDDTLKALQKLAAYYRKQFYIPVVAVTGSVGKTTTKECVGVALSHVFQTRIGLGNLNNHIGVPLNIFKLTPQDQCLVLEMGANHLGEIRTLTEIIQPTVGVLTCVKPVHLEGFGSMDGIYRGKLELADYLEQTGGTLVVNGDDPELLERLGKKKLSLITFGTKPECNFRMSNLSAKDGFISFRVNDQFLFRFKGYGGFNAWNALAAIAVAGFLNIDLKGLSEAWTALPAIQGRFWVSHWAESDIIVVNDAYNANPYAFERGLESFLELAHSRRKVVVLGDMLELGNEADKFHAEVGSKLATAGVDVVVGVGPLSSFAVKSYAHGHRAGFNAHFENRDEASKYLCQILEAGDALFIKGSHGMKLEDLPQLLKQACAEKVSISS